MKDITKLNYNGLEGVAEFVDFGSIVLSLDDFTADALYPAEREAIEELFPLYDISKGDFEETAEQRITEAEVYYLETKWDIVGLPTLTYFRIQLVINDYEDVYCVEDGYVLTPASEKKIMSLPAELRDAVPHFIPFGFKKLTDGVLTWED